MEFIQRRPRPPLNAFVESVWLCRNNVRAHALERVLPTGSSQLIVNLKEDRTRLYDPERPQRCITTSGTIFSGLQSCYQIIDTSEQEYVAGVAFKPGGASAFMRMPAYETNNADTPLEFLWSRSRAADLRDQLLEGIDGESQLDALEAALNDMLRPAAIHPAVAFALTAFDRVPVTTTIGDVTDAIGMSAKRFIERFKAHVGVTPKRYCRIRRFQRAVTQAHQGRDLDWTRVAMDCGYFDQAHFIHEFRSFAGMTPTGYLASRTEFQNHVKFLQSDAAAI
jgi:AraC-like DNA-binding protein